MGSEGYISRAVCCAAGAQTTLQEEYKPGMSLKEAEVLALSTLKQVMEEKVRAAAPTKLMQHI